MRTNATKMPGKNWVAVTSGDNPCNPPANPLAFMTLLLAIIGHLVGDYLLQNDWMALNKKQHSLPCAVHCTLWTLAVCGFAGWISLPAIAVLWVTHFIQDRTHIIEFWMTKINRQPEFVKPPFTPWSLIVVDNVWHIVAVWAVWRFLMHQA